MYTLKEKTLEAADLLIWVGVRVKIVMTLKLLIN